MYPSMLSRGPLDIETEPYYCLPVSGVSIPWSQPTSPTPRGLSSLLSPTHSNHRLVYQKKNDEGKTKPDREYLSKDKLACFFSTIAHGSQLSLMSGSSMYGSTTEEQRQANEVRRLKRELTEAREQVMSLSSQLSTNVSAFISIAFTITLSIHKRVLFLLFVMFSTNNRFTNKMFSMANIDIEKKLFRL